ncbi:AMP-binding protein [Amycolatopsis kentuckyensis]|uniref:AMP-binding protein n=1 Tax=Amycolatopsis kentuckyensis TaxID=218823 RepID=UPI00356626B1
MLTSSERVFGGRVAEAGATTLSTLLAGRAAVAGDEPALTWLGTTWTWAALNRRVTAVAAALRQVTEPRQRAAILVARPVDHVVAFLGAIRAGLVAIPLAAGNRAAFADAEPSIVLATADTVAATRRFLSGLDTCGHRVLAVDIVEEAGEFTEDPVAAEDVAYLQYPAGVLVTHANILANARQVAGVLPGRTIASWLPPCDPLGLLLAVALPVTTGRPVVLFDRREPLSSLPLDAGTLASAADPDLARFREAFAAGAVRVCHVLAEATAVVSVEGTPAGQRIAIVDSGGRRRPRGEVGEIWVSGPNVGRGYWNRPEESARVFCALLAEDDEPRWWLRTGDLGFLAESGALSVLGRVVGGHDPRDLEGTVRGAHAAVRAAAAFGGERVVVVVELRPGEVPPRGEVERAVRAALSAGHGLTPRRVVVLPSGAALGGLR